jgi:chromate reductase, NAD(P)H dehydrogenase (quinone)
MSRRRLPAFDHDDADPLPPAVGELRAQIAEADGILFCTPEYAGGLPGSFKNLLDWTVGGTEMYRKPVAWITGYLGATIIESAGTRVVVARADLDADGELASAAVRARLHEVARDFADGMRIAGHAPEHQAT